MPQIINPNIALGVRPVEIQSPDEAALIVARRRAIQAEEQERTARANERARKESDARALQAIWQAYGDDPKEAIKRTYRVNPALAAELEEGIASASKEHFASLKAQTDAETANTERLVRYLGAIQDGDDTSYQQIRPEVIKHDPMLERILPPSIATPEGYAQLQQGLMSGVSAVEQLKSRQHGLDSLLKGEYQEALGNLFSTANTPDEHAQMVDDLKYVVPAAMLKPFREFNPERAKTLALGQKGVSDVAHQRAQEAATLRGQDLSTETQIRGQDLSAATQRRGQDVSAATQRRGQDMTDARAKTEGAGGAKLSAAAVEKIAGADTALASANRINELLPTYTGTLGPLAGTAAQFKQLTPAADEGYAEFAAEVTTLKNAVIKAITGAQMSEPEAARIMRQVPDLTNQPAVFRARMKATVSNLETLKRRTIELSGGSVPEETQTQRRPIPGIAGGEAELRNGRWIRVK